MKKCQTCKQCLPLATFGNNRKKPDGLMAICKKCNTTRVRAWQLANPEKAKHKPERSIHRHGLTVELHAELLNKFSGLCHACKENPATVIDHDHSCCTGTYSCGKCVRGLTCHSCNTALGLLKDSGKRIIDLLDYTLRSF